MKQLLESTIGRLRLACFLLAALSHASQAQTLAPSPPAVCVAPTVPPTPASRDSSAITGVDVRFTTNASGRPADAHVAKALSALTAERLQALVDAPVRSRFDFSPSPAQSWTSSAVADGRRLGIRWIVTGRAERVGDSVSVSWSVHDAQSGAARGTGLAREALVHLDALAGQLSLAVAGKIGATSASANSVKAAPGARSVVAFEQYLAGLYDFESFEISAQRRAVSAFQRAVQGMPTMQPAWTALAETLTRMVEWGEGGSARGRSRQSRDALVAARRALSLTPRDARTLVVIAHLHLLRDEPDSAARAIDALRAIAPGSDDLLWLPIELALLRGDERVIASAMNTDSPRSSRNARALYLRAEWNRRLGKLPAACQSLNRLLVLEPTWAPAYVFRALVRSAFGDRRGGWQDAEMATRLGQPTWGNMVSALIDFSVSDSLRMRARLRELPPTTDNTVLPWLDVLLQGAVWRAAGQSARATLTLSLAPCDDPRRRRFSGDPLLGDLKIFANDCRVSVGLTNPADNFPK